MAAGCRIEVRSISYLEVAVRVGTLKSDERLTDDSQYVALKVGV